MNTENDKANGCAEDKRNEGAEQIRHLLWVAEARGYAELQCELGDCYIEGNGIQKDFAEGVRWYRKAAEQGYAKAQFKLAYCLQVGKGLEKDEAAAIGWYLKAAEHGCADAPFQLGCLYEKYGNDKDALKWFQVAAENGSNLAGNRVAILWKKQSALSRFGEHIKDFWKGFIGAVDKGKKKWNWLSFFYGVAFVFIVGGVFSMFDSGCPSDAAENMNGDGIRQAVAINSLSQQSVKPEGVVVNSPTISYSIKNGETTATVVGEEGPELVLSTKESQANSEIIHNIVGKAIENNREALSTINMDNSEVTAILGMLNDTVKNGFANTLNDAAKHYNWSVVNGKLIGKVTEELAKRQVSNVTERLDNGRQSVTNTFRDVKQELN